MRIKKINLYNIKGIINGDIDLCKFNDGENLPNVIGFFGPNGTGKTSVLEVLASLKSLINGKKLNTNLIGNRNSFSEIKLELDNLGVNYSFGVKFTHTSIIEEYLKIDNSVIYYLSESNIDYPEIFKDKNVVKTLFMNNELQSIFFNRIYYEIIKLKLKNCNIDLFMQFFDNLTYLSANYIYNNLAPIIIGNRLCNILKRVQLTLSEYEYLNSVYNRVNIVLKRLVNRELILRDRGIVRDDLTEYQTVIHYEDTFIDISQESLGIKRLILYLIYLIPLINNPNSCLCIDEIDSGIFELLLKELLLAMNSDRAGQLIFTAHNFEAINILQSENIVIATLDDNNKFITFNDYQILDAYLETIRNDVDEQFYNYIDTYTLRKLLKGVNI